MRQPKGQRNAIHYLEESMACSLANASHQLVAVGAIAFFGFILFYWVWTEWYPQLYENLFLRLLSSLLGLGLVLTPYWPVSFKHYLPWYWFVTIVYTLSFFFAFSFLMNQASMISAMSLLCSVFLLVLLVDLYSLIIVLFSGWGIAVLLYLMLGQPVYFGAEHIEMVLVSIFVVVAGTVFNYKTVSLQQQRLAGMAAAASMIAHELRTPLLGIKSGAQALIKHSPKIIEGYQQARLHGLIDHPVKEARLGLLAQISDRIVNEIDYTNTIIDMLLVNAGRDNSLQNCTLEVCSMAECLTSALTRYPFKTSRERNLISWQGDFYFRGSKLLMQHVLFNLIKNALYAIALSQKGEISIWTETGQKYHYLYVRDTGQGMSNRQLAKVFQHFYTTKYTGTGIGLSFCKLVMDRFRGTMHCEAKEGEFTLFTLSFPLYEPS